MILRRVSPLPALAMGFGDLDKTRREVERLFDSLDGLTRTGAAGVFPAVNVSEDAEAVYVRAELPGVDAGDLDITVENDTLSIRGERRPAAGDETVSFHRRERGWGAFRRSLSLPCRVDSAEVQALYRDGLLTITLPKAAEARPQRISVRADA